MNALLAERTFRMGQLTDVAPSLRHFGPLFMAHIQYACYQLRRGKEDQELQALIVGADTLIIQCLNLRLLFTPWFFKRAIQSVPLCRPSDQGGTLFSYRQYFLERTRLLAANP